MSLEQELGRLRKTVDKLQISISEKDLRLHSAHSRIKGLARGQSRVLGDSPALEHMSIILLLQCVTARKRSICVVAGMQCCAYVENDGATN